ncbi:hypothetical protein Tco_1168037 [Tanacetum coccineum]
MANLEFCDTHNMVAYLKKPEGSDEFYQIVDFLNASHIRYALTEYPIIYVSLIKQFWETATSRTLDNEEFELTATIDGNVKIVNEASVRRHLQLADSDGTSSLPNTEIFEQLSLMGENIPLFPAMIVQGPVVQGEGSTHPESVVPQPRSPTQSPVADEAASIGVDVRYGGDTTIVTSLEAGQGSGNIYKTPTMPHDLPLPRVNTLGSDEGNMTLQELMVLCTTLSKKVESLETDLKHTKLTYGAAYTKLIKKVKKLENKVNSSQARRRARIIVSDDKDDFEDPSKQGRKIAGIDQDPTISLVQHDAEIQGRHEHDMEFDFDLDAAKGVSTGKPVSTVSAAVTTASIATVSTASPTRRVSTVYDITMAETLVYIRKSATKDKATVRLQAKLEEEDRQKIARVHEASSSFNVEEWEDIQARVKADKELAQRLQAKEREMYTEAEQARMLVELINQRKREELIKKFKRQKTGESSEPAEEPKDKEEELSQEKLQQMMIREIYTKGIRKYWKIIRVGNHTEVHQFFDDILKDLDMDDLVMLWSLVKENFKSTEPTDDKEREIWVELKRLSEPDIDDELWKLQNHIHDLTWKLYDSCGVHRVSIEKGIEIYMLVEKEYPLLRGVLTLMLVAKLLVEQDNEMSKELLRKIFMQVERPRR